MKKEEKEKTLSVSARFLENKKKVEVEFVGVLPTVNHMYGYGRYNGRMFLKPEAKEIKRQIKEVIENLVVIDGENVMKNDEKKYKVEIVIIREWYYKNGRIKRTDLQNHAKIMIDALFEGIGVDDSRLFELVMRKKQKVKDENEKVMAVIEIEED